MRHLKHRLRIFFIRRRIMFHSRDIQVFVFLTIPWFTKCVTSRWVLVLETRCIFGYIFWTTTHEATKLGQLIDISKGDNFQKFFEQSEGVELDSRSFLVQQPDSRFQCFSLYHSAKTMLEMFVMQRTSIWPKIILIGLRIQKK